MKYRLLGNRTGVILTRSPELHNKKDFYVEFMNAPEGAVAVFECGGKTFYREIQNGRCAVLIGVMSGDVEVTVFLHNDRSPITRWKCEDFHVNHISDVSIMVAPSDADLQAEVVRIRVENDQLRDEQARLNERLLELDKKLTRIMEGYNIT